VLFLNEVVVTKQKKQKKKQKQKQKQNKNKKKQNKIFYLHSARSTLMVCVVQLIHWWHD
jgi:hypothetical protein